MTPEGTERFHTADHRQVRSMRAARTTVRHGSGTMASSIPPIHDPFWAQGIAAAMNAPQTETRFGVFRM